MKIRPDINIPLGKIIKYQVCHISLSPLPARLLETETETVRGTVSAVKKSLSLSFSAFLASDFTRHSTEHSIVVLV